MAKTKNGMDLFFSQTSEFTQKHITREAGRSEHLQTLYMRGLSVFYDYIQDIKKMDPLEFRFTDCTYRFLSDYVQYLREDAKYKESTVKSMLSSIKEYLKYVSDGNHAWASIYLSAKRVTTPSAPKKMKSVVEKDDLKDVFNAPKNTRLGNRDRFILIFLYDTGFRVGELEKLTLGDIQFDNDDISVIVDGKGRKERCIVLSSNCVEHMRKYLDSFHEGQLEDSNRPLFYTTIHDVVHPMSARNIQKIVHKYGVIAHNLNPNIPESITPHTLRRTCGTVMYQDGVPIEQVSAFLGHSKIQTTQDHYARPSREQLKKAAEKGSQNIPRIKETGAIDIGDVKKKLGLRK